MTARKRSSAIVIILFLSIGSCGIPKGLSVDQSGDLKDCPKSPNCISSQAELSDERHYMQAWNFSDIDLAKQKIKKAISDFGSAEIMSEKEDYIHAVFITGFWRYKDDVEFYFDREQGLVHFRSASRLGYSDQGVNRDRMEKLQELYNR